MPELSIFLRPQEPMLLPADHHDLLQGLFYSLLSAEPALSEQVHGGGMKCYSFTDLTGESRPMGERLLYPGTVRWTFRAADERLTEVLNRAIRQSPAVRIGQTDCAVTEVSLTERQFFTNRLKVTMATPLLAYHTAERRTFHSPEEEEFYAVIRNGLIRRYRTFTGSEPPGEVRFLPLDAEEKRDRRAAQFKGSYLRGYYGTYLLTAPPEVLTFAYCAGLGSKTSAGFGAVGTAEPME